MFRITFAVLLVSTGVAIAAPPSVTGLFPSGAATESTAEITVTGKLNQPGTEVWTKHPGLSFEIPESGEAFKVTVAADAPAGLAWLRFHNADGAASLVPFVIGTLREQTESEPNNDLKKAARLEGPRVINAKLGQGGDVDVFAIDLKKGQTLVSVIDANWRLAAPVDCVLQVLAPNGAVVEQVDDDRGNDPQLAVTATVDGTWYVRVFGFPAAPNSSIGFAGAATYRYRLTMTTGPYATHAIPSVVNAETGKLRLGGWNLSESLAGPLDVAADRDATMPFSHPSLPAEVPLARTENAVAVETEPCSREKPLQIAIGTVACGTVDEPGDEDSYAFTAKKGQRLQFRVESRSLGYPLDAQLRLIDSTGKQLAVNDDSGRNVFDPLLKFNVPADGDYRICLRDLFDNGGFRFAYRLFCEEQKPDVQLAVKSDAFTVRQTEELSIPVTVTRSNGFAEELSIELTGLPEGLTCEPVKSEAKGDSSKAVTLKFKADIDKLFRGPIQVTTKTADGKSRLATAPLATYKTNTTDLWLTVTAKPKDEKKPDSENKE